MGTGWAQASAGAFLFHSYTVPSALYSRYVPRRAGSSTSKRGRGGHPDTHRAKCRRSKVHMSSGLLALHRGREAQDQFGVGRTVDRLGGGSQQDPS